LSSGDLLRKNITEQTVLGQQARQYVADGRLVPDDLLISLIDDELLQVGNTVSKKKNLFVILENKIFTKLLLLLYRTGY
jgi:adenylate kinase family enzyme